MIINSPLNWQVHYDYARSGLGQGDPFSNISTAFTTASTDLFGGLGPTELLLLGLGAFALISMIFTTTKSVGAVRGYSKRRRSRRREALQRQMDLL